MPGTRGLLLALDHVWRLVRRDADAVPGAVDEGLAVSRVGDDGSGGAVDVLAGRAGTNRVDSGLLGLADDLVNLADLVRRLADAHGAGGVGPVAVLEPAEVEHHRIPDLDHPVAGLVVRVGAVGAGSDDGEVDLLVAELAQQRREVGGDLGLTSPRRIGA